MMQTHCNNVSVSGCVVQGTEAPPAAAKCALPEGSVADRQREYPFRYDTHTPIAPSCSQKEFQKNLNL